ncbi:MAG: IS630 transposase-related protein [Planctomycetota bacterium]
MGATAQARGDIAPRKTGPRGPHKIDREALAAAVARQPDATLAELREAFGIGCSFSAICVALRRLKLSYTKRRSTPPPPEEQSSRTGPMSPSVERPGG